MIFPSNESLPPEASIREALAIIDRLRSKIALITDPDGRLVGTVTDGDIRRGLLRGETFESPVLRIMHRDFLSLPQAATEQDALDLMRTRSLHQIPVLDGGGRVVRLFLIDDLIKADVLENTVVIMAGGEGRRLRPLTEDCPKPMLPLGNKPLLEILLEQCIATGFRRFLFSVNYLKHQIIDYFGDGKRWAVNIGYLEEETPLGTAGALGLLAERPSHPLLVLNGDVLTRVDFKALLRFHNVQGADATVCVRDHITEIPFGVVEVTDSQVQALQEKPVLHHYVNAGLYLLAPRVLDLLDPGKPCDMPMLIERMLHRMLRVSAFPVHEYWLDIGRHETYNRAHGEWQ